jgi:hypothetical protein
MDDVIAFHYVIQKEFSLLSLQDISGDSFTDS